MATQLGVSSPAPASRNLPDKTRICTSLTAATVAGQIEQANAAAQAGADLVEIRVDLLDPSEAPSWSEILSAAPLPVIVTNRPIWEGGQCADPDEQRLAVLFQAVELQASHIDVELVGFPSFKAMLDQRGLTLPFERTRLIVSHHNFDRPLRKLEIESVQMLMRSARADVAKIAMATTSALDNAIVFDTLRNATMPTVMLAMGELGQLSRIVAPRFGAYLTFASVGKGKESAPGQVDTDTLTNVYRFHDISKSTPMYGVIGNPVSHSMSPALHNAALAHTKTDGVYVPLKVEADFAEFIRRMAGLGFEGFSVTIPGKVPAMEGMDKVDEVAAKIGAMNTVVRNDDGTLKGYNTDWVAAISAVEEHVEGGLPGKRVVCIGAGGAGRALAFGALERGAANVIVVNRTGSKAVELAEELGERASGISLDKFNAGGIAYDVLMNSTSVGMHPNIEDSPVKKEVLVEDAVVFDAVYNPLRTRLIREAEELGCVTVSGLEMFVRQAAEQFRLWFPDTEIPVEVMRSVVLEKLNG